MTISCALISVFVEITAATGFLHCLPCAKVASVSWLNLPKLSFPNATAKLARVASSSVCRKELKENFRQRTMYFFIRRHVQENSKQPTMYVFSPPHLSALHSTISRLQKTYTMLVRLSTRKHKHQQLWAGN